LTRKAEHVIKSADIVLYDKLVDERIIALVPKKIQLVDVGKDPNRAQKKGALMRAFLAADEVARNPAGMRTPFLGLPAH